MRVRRANHGFSSRCHGLRRRTTSVMTSATTVTTMNTVEIALSDGSRPFFTRPKISSGSVRVPGAGGEVGDDQLVERERERHQPARDDRGHQIGHQHLREGLQRRGAEIERRFFEGRIEPGEARLHRQPSRTGSRTSRARSRSSCSRASSPIVTNRISRLTPRITSGTIIGRNASVSSTAAAR